MHKKQSLKFVSLDKICVKEKHKLFEEQGEYNNRSLELSIQERGLKTAFTCYKKEGEYILLNGHRRYAILLQSNDAEFEVPIWLIEGELTEEDIDWFILDLAQVRKLTNRDYLNLYKKYNELVPNNRGKKDSPESRRKIIAEYVGISSSQISKLLLVDQHAPKLFRNVDDGKNTLIQAEQMAKAARSEKKKREEARDNPGSELDDDEEEKRNRVIDLESLPDCCPSCNRTFDITWEDIPNIFNEKRDDTNNQKDWLTAA